MNILSLNNKKLSKIDKSIYILFIIYSLHTLRNLNAPFYFFLLFITLLNVTLNISNFSKLRLFYNDSLVYLFLFTLLLIPFISTFNLNFDDFLTAFLRYIPSTLFIILLSIIRPNNYNLHLKIIRFFVFFTVISGFSILFQTFLNFEIPFLAESSTREGLIRYGSLLGSLTTFGTLGPIAIFSIILFIDEKKLLSKQNFIYLLYILVILSASILTLQKAAILNLLIVIFFYLFFFLNLKNLIYLTLILLPLGLILFLFFRNNQIITTLQVLVDYTFFNDSLNFLNDLASRTTFFVTIFLQSNEINLFTILFGFGFRALSGILGLTNFVMLHNNFYDLLFSGGLLHLLSFLFLVFESMIVSLKNYKNNVNSRNYSKYLLFSLLYFLINMVIGASTIYHPIGGTFFFLLIIFSRVKINIIKTSLQTNVKF